MYQTANKENIGYTPIVSLMLDIKNGDYIKERIGPKGIIHAGCLKSCVNPCRVCRNNRAIVLDELGEKEIEALFIKALKQ